MAFTERKNLRAKFHDYSGGEYFVTICTSDKEHSLGHISSGEIYYSDLGQYAYNELENISTHYPYAEIPIFVVMPNHIHAIVIINEALVGMHRGASTDATNSANDANTANAVNAANAAKTANDHVDAPRCIPTKRTALGVVIGGFKQAVTRFARRNNIEFDWQKRFHDHIIRGSEDGNMISEYIQNNVARWDSDCFNK